MPGFSCRLVGLLKLRRFHSLLSENGPEIANASCSYRSFNSSPSLTILRVMTLASGSRSRCRTVARIGALRISTYCHDAAPAARCWSWRAGLTESTSAQSAPRRLPRRGASPVQHNPCRNGAANLWPNLRQKFVPEVFFRCPFAMIDRLKTMPGSGGES
jgi:hypothetical protein